MTLSLESPRHPQGFPLALLFAFGLLTGSCSLTATRPVQEFSDTTAALRAAKQVQADTLSPELYRQSTEWFFKARREYKFKNFQRAEEYANKARLLAEQAEYEAVRNGGNRTEPAIPDALENSAPPPREAPYSYPTPEATPGADQRPAAPEGATPPSNEGPAAAPNIRPGSPVPTPSPF